MACFFCGGPAHPATGCQYTERALACATCVRRFWAWFRPFMKGKGRRRGPAFYDHAFYDHAFYDHAVSTGGDTEKKDK